MDAASFAVITLRDAFSEDLADIVALDRNFSPVYASPERYAQYLRAPGILCVAMVDEVLAGFALWHQVENDASLLNLAISDRWRRSGLAKRLLVRGEQRLLESGAQRILLEVRESNMAAISLYSTFAFKVDGQRKNYYPGIEDGPRETALLMSKDLETVHAST